MEAKTTLDSETADLLFGPVISEDRKWKIGGDVVISCPAKSSAGLPSQRVINALVRRGRRVFKTTDVPFHVIRGSISSPPKTKGAKLLDFDPNIPPGQ